MRAYVKGGLFFLLVLIGLFIIIETDAFLRLIIWGIERKIGCEIQTEQLERKGLTLYAKTICIQKEKNQIALFEDVVLSMHSFQRHLEITVGKTKVYSIPGIKTLSGKAEAPVFTWSWQCSSCTFQNESSPPFSLQIISDSALFAKIRLPCGDAATLHFNNKDNWKLAGSFKHTPLTSLARWLDVEQEMTAPTSFIVGEFNLENIQGSMGGKGQFFLQNIEDKKFHIGMLADIKAKNGNLGVDFAFEAKEKKELELFRSLFSPWLPGSRFGIKDLGFFRLSGTLEFSQGKVHEVSFREIRASDLCLETKNGKTFLVNLKGNGVFLPAFASFKKVDCQGDIGGIHFSLIQNSQDKAEILADGKMEILPYLLSDEIPFLKALEKNPFQAHFFYERRGKYLNLEGNVFIQGELAHTWSLQSQHAFSEKKGWKMEYIKGTSSSLPLEIYFSPLIKQADLRGKLQASFQIDQKEVHFFYEGDLLEVENAFGILQTKSRFQGKKAWSVSGRFLGGELDFEDASFYKKGGNFSLSPISGKIVFVEDAFYLKDVKTRVSGYPIGIDACFLFDAAGRLKKIQDGTACVFLQEAQTPYKIHIHEAVFPENDHPGYIKSELSYKSAPLIEVDLEWKLVDGEWKFFPSAASLKCCQKSFQSAYYTYEENRLKGFEASCKIPLNILQENLYVFANWFRGNPAIHDVFSSSCESEADVNFSWDIDSGTKLFRLETPSGAIAQIKQQKGHLIVDPFVWKDFSLAAEISLEKEGGKIHFLAIEIENTFLLGLEGVILQHPLSGIFPFRLLDINLKELSNHPLLKKYPFLPPLDGKVRGKGEILFTLNENTMEPEFKGSGYLEEADILASGWRLRGKNAFQFDWKDGALCFTFENTAFENQDTHTQFDVEGLSFLWEKTGPRFSGVIKGFSISPIFAEFFWEGKTSGKFIIKEHKKAENKFVVAWERKGNEFEPVSFLGEGPDLDAHFERVQKGIWKGKGVLKKSSLLLTWIPALQGYLPEESEVACIGWMKVPSNKYFPSFSEFKGSLHVKGAYAGGLHLDELSCQIEAKEESVDIKNLAFVSKGPNGAIEELAFRKKGGDWYILGSGFTVRDISFGELMGEKDSSPALASVFFPVVHLNRLEGVLGNKNSFIGNGYFRFEPAISSQTKSLLAMPLDLIKKVGFDKAALFPVMGTVYFDLYDEKIWLQELENAYSPKKMSKFHLAKSTSSYIDFQGNCSITMRMKQYNFLLKLAEPFAVVVSGPIKSPAIRLQKE